MLRKEAILGSPLRILDRSIRGGLGKGHLGVIAAPAGVGKSACLAQLGLDALLRERPVLHLSVGQSVEHVSARYDALFDELAERVDLADRRGVREALAQRRLLWSSRDEPLNGRAIREALSVFEQLHRRAPHAVLVDGFAWRDPAAPAELEALKAEALRAGAELWMTAEAGAGADGALANLPAGAAALVDVAILLEPLGRQARLSLVKDFDRRPADVHLVLEGGALRRDEEEPAPAANQASPPGDFTLLASGSSGAEAEFGACAERWGLREVNYTFAGRREVARTRGQRELSEEELRLGDVSAAYVRAHLHRALPDSPELHRVLEAIWHQVSSAEEVFSVGGVGPDGTAQGGTGWAVELARTWGKPVHLFDQGRGSWLRWDGKGWVAEAPPAITRPRFAGAGTRALTEGGRAAIRALFERSFGAPPE